MAQDTAALKAGRLKSKTVEPLPESVDVPAQARSEPETLDSHEGPASQRTLLQRILTGFGAALIIIALIFIPRYHGLPFVLSLSLISILGASEFYNAVRRQGAEPSDVLGFAACIVFQFIAWRSNGNSLDPVLPGFLTILVLASMLVELVKPKQKPILNIGATLLGAIYCGWLFSFLSLLHGVNILVKAPIVNTTQGEWLVLFVVAVTSFGDVGGFIFGSLIGRHKLAPNISPSKSWEGAAGSILIATGVAIAIGYWIHLNMGLAIAMGVILAIVGLTGDLCESALKRELGVKDFGVILPGHGGLLDRIDSLLFTAPVAYYCFMFFLHARH